MYPTSHNSVSLCGAHYREKLKPRKHFLQKNLKKWSFDEKKIHFLLG